MDNPLTVLASPAWRGVEGDMWRASSPTGSVILKHYHPDTAFYVDVAASMRAAAMAGDAGIGPSVTGMWASHGIIAFEELAPPWRSGGLQDVVNAHTRTAVIEAKKAFQSLTPIGKPVSIFDEIDTFVSMVRESSVATHRDLGVFVSFFADARHKIASAGQDRVPCHRDGNTANYMVGGDTSVRLIDFDLAGDCDPFEDIGCHLVEFFENDLDARAGFEEWHGSFDEGLFQRAMLYGLADDLRWGLIGALMGAKSARSHLEFSKYAAWRFLRLEARLKSSDANDRIRVAA
ncbi:putative phosphotransferase [Roseobacter litoralis Och 149]|uniref:Phosphotransferase n=2 Tax=Roseobacter litoralis TaxID=42443 RepID=F7ZG56_ROSLO|nr:putative phosphotransferase [Roseobacter litoralis Och 149]